ncbi:MAG TPA: alpha/beta hydrolase [Verrucomicrobiae bacterium]|nr:alpha/beta hydrolase [Verrucomicrobiae bacterium]
MSEAPVDPAAAGRSTIKARPDAPNWAKMPELPGKGVQECSMDFDGARMRYLKAGSGPALILLHGLMGYSFSWRYAMPAVVPYATVYAPDLLGAGFSDRPQIDHSMRATAQRVLRFARNLELESFDLLGTSRGGAVAMCAAAESLGSNGPHVRKLILVAPVNPYSAHGRWLAPAAGSRLGSRAVRWVMEKIPGMYPYWHGRMFGDPGKIPPGSLEGYTAPLAIPGLFEHAISIVSTWTADLRELEALLPRLAPIPTLLMWGSKDPAVYVSSMKPLARHFPNARKVVFPGVGHLPYEECPDDFNRELIGFLVGGKRD